MSNNNMFFSLWFFLCAQLTDTDCVELCKTIRKDRSLSKSPIFIAATPKQRKMLQVSFISSYIHMTLCMTMKMLCLYVFVRCVS